MAKKWRCTVCGYIHEGPEAPDQCPMCKVGKEKFVEVMEQEGNLEFVTEHVIGDGKGASKELWEGLQNHFMGECTEVGMYLAMSRQADREGYPEIAEAYKRYAWEEAEHASKFAELIGEVVWDTKTNLYKRMNAESGACEDKMRLEKFVEVMEQEGNLEFVTEHVIGDGKGASKELWEGLQNHFMGECTEVGMYLAMSRQADREGYPEIAEAYKRYAWEEAEHASKFAELIGEVVWDTKTNLYKRMNAESGACEDKMRLARMAKEQNLDAVHDTVHEMAKDEARHGKGFEGLYKRYFGK